MKQLISHEELLRVLVYNSETGIFKWKVKPSAKVKIGATAGTPHNSGYICVMIYGVHYMAHRLAWFHYYGVWPTHLIDHRDTIKTNNWISNLREASYTENLFNTTKRCSNTSGYRGVYFNKQLGKYIASSTISGNRVHLGCFVTPELASEAYQMFVKEYHGQFYYSL